ncbi:MAG TPA: Nramp family divalent metal transporter, partial [Pirellulaceae bacterium]|nr:Nramp family divalent metal transporter [Pirellulaceae bacterium]
MANLTAWGKDDLPEPLPFNSRNLFKVIGPGAILLAASIGGGEWLVGPAIAVKHGQGLMWIASVGIILQLLFNLEGIRYTLYTGEPILSGIMRLKPGANFWATFYVILTVAQLGVPALGAACATVLFTAISGHVPAADGSDSTSVLFITYGAIL